MENVVSADTALKIILCGLGQPFTTPPGCCNILLGCLHILDEALRTDVLAPNDRVDLYTTLMRFITEPRTQQDIDQLALDLVICRCHVHNAPTIISTASPLLHVPRAGTPSPNLAELLLVSSRVLTNALMEKAAHETKACLGSMIMSRWPTSDVELMPYGPFVTLHMLDAWSRNYSDTCMYLGEFYPHLVKRFGSHLVPGLLKTHSGLNCVYTVIDRVMRMEDDGRVPRLDVRSVIFTLYAFSQVARLFKTVTSLFTKHELLIWLDGGERTREEQIMYISSLLDYASTIVTNLASTLRTASMASGVDMIAEAMFTLTENICVADPECIGYAATPEFRKHLRMVADKYSSTFNRLLIHGYDGNREGRCAGPGCLKTQGGMGRRFKQCGGCHAMFYCSRRCQKRGWTYPGGSHRELCEISLMIRVCKAKSKDSKRSPDVVLAMYMTSPDAEKATTSVETLYKSQLDAMRK
jgi:hypothetical protein